MMVLEGCCKVPDNVAQRSLQCFWWWGVGGPLAAHLRKQAEQRGEDAVPSAPGPRDHRRRLHAHGRGFRRRQQVAGAQRAAGASLSFYIDVQAPSGSHIVDTTRDIALRDEELRVCRVCVRVYMWLVMIHGWLANVVNACLDRLWLLLLLRFAAYYGCCRLTEQAAIAD